MSLILTLLFILPALFLIVLAALDTKLSGVFIQKRVGSGSNLFTMFKIRTLNKEGVSSKFGKFLRRSKLDELPQLINILFNEMSFVGPRPELPEYFEKHKDYPQDVLKFKPGLTGLASLYFYNEDQLVPRHSDLEFEKWMYLRKNKLNQLYIKNQSWCYDVKIMYFTFVKFLGINL